MSKDLEPKPVFAELAQGKDGVHVTVVQKGPDGNLKFDTGVTSSMPGALKALVGLLPANARLVSLEALSGNEPRSTNGHNTDESVAGLNLGAGERVSYDLQHHRRYISTGAYDEELNTYVPREDLT